MGEGASACLVYDLCAGAHDCILHLNYIKN